MKKFFLIISVFFLVFAFEINAQKIGVQGTVALPTGDFGDAYSTGFGGTATFLYTVAKNIAIGATAGYLTWSGKDFADGFTFSTIPVLAVGRIAFGSPTFTPYICAQLGMFFSNSSVEITDPFLGTTSFDESSSDFGFGGGAGFTLPLSPTVDLDVNAMYNSISSDGSTTSYISVNGGVLIGI